MFIQGSLAFCQEMELYSRLLEGIEVISMVEQEYLGSMDFQGQGNGESCHCVTHQEVGGMMDSSWNISCGTKINRNFRVNMKRHVGMILCPTYNGNLVTKESVDNASSLVLRSGDLLPI